MSGIPEARGRKGAGNTPHAGHRLRESREELNLVEGRIAAAARRRSRQRRLARPSATYAGIIATTMDERRLSEQIAFLIEVDKLKRVARRTPLIDSSRRENSAEHSWHLLLVALVLREYADSEINIVQVLKMLALHDLVEIDAGDTFAYDAVGEATRETREREAADRIFGLLPRDQALSFRGLWEEFESRTTPESQFANAVDRFQPLLQNAWSDGGSWSAHGLQRDQVLARMAPVQIAAPCLWPFVVRLVDAFCVSGLLRTVS